MYDHLCPEIDNGSGKPNLLRSACDNKVRHNVHGCARCCANGYKRPAPKKSGPKTKPKEKPVPVIRKCKCGEVIGKGRQLCDDCRHENKAIRRRKFKKEMREKRKAAKCGS